MKKIKIAQIGVGHDHAGQIMETLRRMSDIFEVVGYAIPDDDETSFEWQKNLLKSCESKYEGIPRYTVEEILSMPDLDAVAIETFDLLLVKYAQMAADRGLHIHMDKAPGESAEAFEQLLSTIKRKDLVFSIGYMYRFNPQVVRVFECAKNGEFGKIHSIDAEMSCFYVKGKRDWLSSFQGGMMQYLGCHLIDLAVRLMGVPEEIIPINVSTAYQGTTAKDCSLAILRYPNGVATVRSSMGDCGSFGRRHLIVNGAEKCMEVRPMERHEKDDRFRYALSSDSTSYAVRGSEHEHSDIFDRYQGMLASFAEMLRGNRKYNIDLETEAIVHRCLLAACGIECNYKEKIEL